MAAIFEYTAISFIVSTPLTFPACRCARQIFHLIGSALRISEALLDCRRRGRRFASRPVGISLTIQALHQQEGYSITLLQVVGQH